MSFAKVYCAQTHFLKAHPILIEVDISKGLHAFSIVGLPDKAVEESRDRISAAIKNSGFTSPKSRNHKVVISLAPADMRKEGPLFDLGMALAYLKASKDIVFCEQKKLFIGELSLDGSVRGVHGVLPLVQMAHEKGFKEVYVPKENAKEAALVRNITVYGVDQLQKLIKHLNQEESFSFTPEPETVIDAELQKESIPFEHIRGQRSAKRGLLIAAAGGHNIVLSGPPGTGKTMLARAFQSILPPLSFSDTLETTAIHSVSGYHEELIVKPPFRSPHHSSSHVSILGGGSIPKPGEVTLAHNGVLFLDEFPEFDRRVIDGLRQPLEERKVHISRARGRGTFPARFILVAAMNPCPCGNFGSTKACVCIPSKREAYARKISGPIMDRIDMWIDVPHIDPVLLSKPHVAAQEDKDVRERIVNARRFQQKRFTKSSIERNSDMNARHIDTLAALEDAAKNTLLEAAQKLDMSPRAYHRTIKLARTIADLEEKESIEESHILEALQYRPKQL